MQMFSKGMEKWLSNLPVHLEGDFPSPDNDIGQTTFEGFLHQEDIGWDQAIRGRISKLLAKANARTTLALMTTGQHKLSQTYGFLASINNGKPETLSSSMGKQIRKTQRY